MRYAYMLGMQSEVYSITRYTIDNYNRDTIADRDMVADAGAAADSDPRQGRIQDSVKGGS